MDYDPSAELRDFEYRRRHGLLGATPDMLSDGLEGAAAPIELDATVGAEEVGNEEMFARQAARIKTDDYRREQALYRVAKVTGTPVAELMQQPEWAGLGEVRGDAIVPLAARAAMKQTRMDGEQERMDAWKAQMKLASSNTRANMSNAFGMLSPEQQQRVIESRVTGNRQDNNDPRLAMAQLDAETRRAEGQETRASNREIAEANRIAAREEREGVRETETLRLTSRDKDADRKHAELMQQQDKEMKLMLQKMESGDEAAVLRSKETLASIQAQIATSEKTATSRADADRHAADQQLEGVRLTAGATESRVKATENQLAKTTEAGQAAKREAEAVAFAGPGGMDIVRGNLETPEAQEALKRLAAKADQTWNGFFTEDARRLDAMLVRIGIVDPAQRRQLVQQYGIDSDIPGQRGRGALSSAWRVGHPEYSPAPAAE